MLPTMRYETSKLAQLLHQRKSYESHRQSIDKIKRKQLRSPANRSKQLEELRDRMHSSFNYTQMVRSREIRKDNLKLYEKCFMGQNTSRAKLNPQQPLQEPIVSSQRQSIDQGSPTARKTVSHWVLRNHRNSPIHKLTPYERHREDMRLAGQIKKPMPAISTRKLESEHEENKKLREMIQKYESHTPKSSSYIERRLSASNFLNSSRSKGQKSIFRGEDSSQRKYFGIEP